MRGNCHELRKILYRDRRFIIIISSILLLSILILGAFQQKEIIAEQKELNESINNWEKTKIPDYQLSVTQDEYGINFIMESNDGKTTDSICAKPYFITNSEAVTQGIDLGAIICILVILAGFIEKWYLRENGRRKEFQNMLPVHSNNMWKADLLEGVGIVIVSVTIFYFYSAIIQIHSMYQISEQFNFVMKLSYVKMWDFVAMWALSIIYILFLFSILLFVKELTNQVLAVIGVFPLTYFSIPILLLVADFIYGKSIHLTADQIYMGVHTEEVMEAKLIDFWPWSITNFNSPLYSDKIISFSTFDPLKGFGLWSVTIVVILSLLAFIGSYLLHKNRDISGNKIIRFRMAENVYLFLMFCIFFLVFYLSFMDWKLVAGRYLVSIPIAAVFTFAIKWLISGNKYKKKRDYKEGLV